MTPRTKHPDDTDPTGVGAFVLKTGRPASVQVFEHLRAEIIGGGICPGAQLSEAKLCARFNLSRQPVREALLRLSTEDLVRVYPQRGSVVAPISVPVLKRAQIIREAVEVEMVSRAIDNRDDRFLADLATELRVQETFAAAGETSRFYESDQFFHRRICDQSGVKGIWESLEASRTQMDRARRSDLRLAADLTELIAQHREIEAGIIAGNKDQAIAAMRAHLRRVLSVLSAAIERTPELFEGADEF